jgi:hypothetical protein
MDAAEIAVLTGAVTAGTEFACNRLWEVLRRPRAGDDAADPDAIPGVRELEGLVRDPQNGALAARLGTVIAARAALHPDLADEVRELLAVLRAPGGNSPVFRGTNHGVVAQGDVHGGITFTAGRSD